jgi:hypothetical protein
VAQAVESLKTLNGLCPYFTMFPLNFPLKSLSSRVEAHTTIVDPFCGRGTTNFAARLCGLNTIAMDSSPVATAITAAKLVQIRPHHIVAEAQRILSNQVVVRRPQGDFWENAYDGQVLTELCRLRKALIERCDTPSRLALRGVLLGALHGPVQRTKPSYFSNQCPRTYAPKPAYAVKFWRQRNLLPPAVSVIEIIKNRASRFYDAVLPSVGFTVHQGDSRSGAHLNGSRKIDCWTITSPPYYGMKTYIPDQWLRNWFVGGSAKVDYSNDHQLSHESPESFSEQLGQVWTNVANLATRGSRLTIRFGGISDRNASPKEVIRESLLGGDWEIQTIKSAGHASDGRRQANGFLKVSSTPIEEYDVWAQRC